MLLKLAWKNLWRNRNRSLITMAAIFFAVILSVVTSSLQDGVFDNLIRNMVGFYTGYIQIHKKGYWEEQILENSFAVSASIEKKILKVSNVNAFSRRLESFALASSESSTKGSLVVGIEPAKEAEIINLESKLKEGAYLSNGDNAVLMGAGLAEQMKLKVGDTLVLIGQGYHGATAAGKFPIKGIVRFGSPDLNDKSVFMPLALMQDLFSAFGQVTSLIVSMDKTDALDQTTEGLRTVLGAEYEVMTWEEIMPEVVQHIATDTASLKIITGILYLLICFGIFGTLLMMMVERKYELGMLLAIGMKKLKLSLLLMIESVFVVIVGCLLGILVSIPVVYYLHQHPIYIGGDMAEVYERFGFEPIFPTSTEAVHFISQGLLVLMIGIVLSLYPILKVWQLDPVTAMRR